MNDRSTPFCVTFLRIGKQTSRRCQQNYTTAPSYDRLERDAAVVLGFPQGHHPRLFIQAGDGGFRIPIRETDDLLNLFLENQCRTVRSLDFPGSTVVRVYADNGYSDPSAVTSILTGFFAVAFFSAHTTMGYALSIMLLSVYVTVYKPRTADRWMAWFYDAIHNAAGRLQSVESKMTREYAEDATVGNNTSPISTERNTTTDKFKLQSAVITIDFLHRTDLINDQALNILHRVAKKHPSETFVVVSEMFNISTRDDRIQKDRVVNPCDTQESS